MRAGSWGSPLPSATPPLAPPSGRCLHRLHAELRVSDTALPEQGVESPAPGAKGLCRSVGRGPWAGAGEEWGEASCRRELQASLCSSPPTPPPPPSQDWTREETPASTRSLSVLTSGTVASVPAAPDVLPPAFQRWVSLVPREPASQGVLEHRKQMSLRRSRECWGRGLQGCGQLVRSAPGWLASGPSLSVCQPGSVCYLAAPSIWRGVSFL